MKVVLTSVVLMLYAAGPGYFQSPLQLLPKGAVIVEQRVLPLPRGRSRTLVLWMVKPSRHPTNYSTGDVYTYPDETRGSYYSGPTRVSLIDPSTKWYESTTTVPKLEGLKETNAGK